MPKTFETLSLQDAKRVLAAGEAKADQMGIPYNIAVVDAGGYLLAGRCDVKRQSGFSKLSFRRDGRDPSFLCAKLT